MHTVENIHHGPDPWSNAVTRPVLLGRHTGWVDEPVCDVGGNLPDGWSTPRGRSEYSCRTAKLTAGTVRARTSGLIPYLSLIHI